MVKKILTKFPSDQAFPVLDIYRMFLMHPHSSEHYKVFETALEYLNILISHLRETKQESTQLVALRCLVNLFNNSASLYVLQQKRQWILDTACQFIYKDNKNIRQAAITLLLNYSILLIDKPDPEGKIQIVSAVSGGAIQKETDAQNNLRLITAIANISY
jgi:PUL domain